MVLQDLGAVRRCLVPPSARGPLPLLELAALFLQLPLDLLHRLARRNRLHDGRRLHVLKEGLALFLPALHLRLVVLYVLVELGPHSLTGVQLGETLPAVLFFLAAQLLVTCLDDVLYIFLALENVDVHTAQLGQPLKPLGLTLLELLGAALRLVLLLFLFLHRDFLPRHRALLRPLLELVVQLFQLAALLIHLLLLQSAALAESLVEVLEHLRARTRHAGEGSMHVLRTTTGWRRHGTRRHRPQVLCRHRDLVLAALLVRARRRWGRCSGIRNSRRCDCNGRRTARSRGCCACAGYRGADVLRVQVHERVQGSERQVAERNHTLAVVALEVQRAAVARDRDGLVVAEDAAVRVQVLLPRRHARRLVVLVVQVLHCPHGLCGVAHVVVARGEVRECVGADAHVRARAETGALFGVLEGAYDDAEGAGVEQRLCGGERLAGAECDDALLDVHVGSLALGVPTEH
eukprot:PhM_4_TR18712/c0_g1_i4/m.62239